jgi:Uma2 family endonuclease
MDVAVQRYRFTVDQYHRLGKLGILGPEARVELIDGEIIEMSPIGARHVHCVIFLTSAFSRAVGARALVSTQNPLRLGGHLEPEPDVVVLRPPLSRYANLIPGATDALLIIEVAETSLHYDREVKLPRYAMAGVPEVWIVDLDGNAIEAFRSPSPAGYRERYRHERGEAIAPAAFSDILLSVDDVLG